MPKLNLAVIVRSFSNGVTSLVAGTGISLTNASGPAVTVTATTSSTVINLIGEDTPIPAGTALSFIDGKVVLETGDIIRISAEDNSINVLLSDEELAERKSKWIAPDLKHKKGVLYKYAKTVASASKGCITDGE